MSKQKYNHKEIEQKWIEAWKESQIYKTPDIEKDDNQKFYILDMFPYPSGAGLHVGHVEGYTATDIVSRYYRMQGKKVLHPIGWDAFGLPAENYAIKTGFPPRINTDQAIETFTKQINAVGLSYDWERELGTHRPDYYKWTQWFFLFLYKKGLAYKKEAPVNWCESCKTVLANEQVVDGKCERCDTVVIQKNMSQWFFKITDYAERLLKDLDKIDWPDSTKAGQRNWIGKSEGADVKFQIVDSEEYITVFTTRIDTIFSGTYIILAPEHPLVQKLTTPEQKAEVESYIVKTKKKTELERTGTSKDKSGAFTGSYVINPATDEQIPIWIADFVLVNYGTGAVFADAHDLRDFELAKKFKIPLKVSLVPDLNADNSKIINLEECFEEEGFLINSGQFDGLTSAQARSKIIDWLESKGLATRKINYKLRDWLVSRQRYWGAPIPIVYKKKENSTTKKILIGTRNQAKFDNLVNSMRIPGIEFISLNDIPEIDDSDLVEGNDLLENARLKSEYYFKKTNIPTISTDNVMWLENYPENNGVIVHIRKLANPNSERATDEEVCEYAKKFVAKHGESKTHFIFAISYTDSSGTQSFTSQVKDYILQSEISTNREEGYPLESMLKDPETGEFKVDQPYEKRNENVSKFLMGEFAEKVFENFTNESFLNRLEDAKSKNLKIAAFAVLKNAEGKILALERASDDFLGKTWDLPGGTVDSNSVLEEMEREIQEECGINNTKLNYIYSYDSLNPEFNKNYRIFCFEGKVDQVPKLNSEHSSYKFITNEEAQVLLHWSGHKKAVELTYKNSSEPLNFLILHGFGTNINKLWYQWYKSELEKLGHKAYLVDLPNPDYPNYEDWMNEIESKYGEVLKNPDNLALVGHSMGGYTALKLAEKYKSAKVITVAPGIAPDNSEDYKKYNDKLSQETVQSVIDFYNKGGDLNADKIKQNTTEVVIFYSTDDNAVQSDRQEKVKSQLPFAKVIEFTNRGHFNKTTTEIPELLLHSKIKDNSNEYEAIAVDESELPVILPDDVEFKPTGVSPLTDHEAFHKVNENKYGKDAYRESDTMDTFVDSSWYFFRFADPKNENVFASKEEMQKWAPVDIYVGGAEHTVLHLLYARFFTKVLYDEGYINFDEPFVNLRHPGIILGEDSRKMSKRWGNVINPLDVIDELGADALRMYEMFMGPFDQMKPWSTQTIQGVRRFLDRVYNLKELIKDESNSKIESELNKLIKKVTSDIEDFKFNTAVAEFMKFTNLLEEEKMISKDQWKRLLTILAPFAPFITEELWLEVSGNEWSKENSIHSQPWPKHDESLIQNSGITIGVQVNGKLRGEVLISLDESEESVKEKVLAIDEIKKFVNADEIKKFIYVKGKIVSIVV